VIDVRGIMLIRQFGLGIRAVLAIAVTYGLERRRNPRVGS
jgi:hypothetical protein